MADVTSVNENVTGWYSEMFASGASRVLLFGELVGRSFVSLIRILYFLSTRLSSPLPPLPPGCQTHSQSVWGILR